MRGALSGVVDDAKQIGTDGLRVGVGAAAGILVTDLAVSGINSLTAKSGRGPMISPAMGPLAMLGLGLVGAVILERVRIPYIRPVDFFGGALAIGVAGYVGKMASPAMAATSQPAASGPTAGFGFGRAFAGFGRLSGGRLAGGRMGNLPGARNYLAPGVRNMDATKMFGGATVQIQERRAGLAGANVRVRPVSANLAGVYGAA